MKRNLAHKLYSIKTVQRMVEIVGFVVEGIDVMT